MVVASLKYTARLVCQPSGPGEFGVVGPIDGVESGGSDQELERCAGVDEHIGIRFEIDGGADLSDAGSEDVEIRIETAGIVADVERVAPRVPGGMGDGGNGMFITPSMMKAGSAEVTLRDGAVDGEGAVECF